MKWGGQGGEWRQEKVFHPEHKDVERVQANTLIISSFRGTMETELLYPNSRFCSIFKISHKQRGVCNVVWFSYLWPSLIVCLFQICQVIDTMFQIRQMTFENSKRARVLKMHHPPLSTSEKAKHERVGPR